MSFKQWIEKKRILTIAALLFLAVGQFGWVPKQPTEEKSPLLVFLVRHAEKSHADRDPELSDAGKKEHLSW